MRLTIYDKNNVAVADVAVSDSGTVTEELGGVHQAQFSYSSPIYKDLPIGCYVVIGGVTYRLLKPYKPEQVTARNYSYNITMYSDIHNAENTLMLHDDDGVLRAEFSLTASPLEHVQKWVDNMNRNAGSELWSVGTVADAEAKTITYNKMNCWDAAWGSAGIAATFEMEMWTDGYVVYLGRCSFGMPLELSYRHGLTELKPVQDEGDVRFFTRLFPLGSTKNIDVSKYGYSRLQLPDRSTYVDYNTDVYGVIDDYEEAAFAGIYPSYTGSVSSVRVEELTNKEGEPYTVYYIKDESIPFNPSDYEIPDIVKQVSFLDGDLAGYGDDNKCFDANWDETKKEWEIINIYPSDDTQIPGGNIVPKPGDRYIILNISLPFEYIDDAEQRYKAAVDDFIASYAEAKGTYTCKTDSLQCASYNVPLRVGQNVHLDNQHYFGVGGYDTRITKVVKKINNLYDANITCADKVGTTWKSSVDGQLNELQYQIANKENESLHVIGLKDKTTPSDYNVFSALRSLATFLRKDVADTMPYLLTLLAGVVIGDNTAEIDKDGRAKLLELLVNNGLASIASDGSAQFEAANIGEFIDSMIAGKGIGMKDGRIQTDRLEVRGSMTVMDLIINELHALAGDYSLSDCGTIDNVEFVAADTYKLWIRKDTEHDFTSLDVDDVLFSIVNNLKLGGTDYYTSWMRVISKNANDNTLQVVLYSGEEVPGGVNYPPVAGYNVTRRGNAVMPTEGVNERSQSWLISSREGRIMFLQNVYKPILEDYNYALTIGKIPNLKALEKLPVSENDVGIVAQTIIAENFYQFDYNGDVVSKQVDRGEWSLEVAKSDKPYRNIQHEQITPTGNEYTLLEQHTVYHSGCKWGCLSDKTILEPKWNSSGWVLLEGDKNYRIEFESSRGWSFRRGAVDTVVTAHIFYGNIDITKDVVDTAGTEWEWLRNSGNIPDDNTWKPTYPGEQKNIIHLKNNDVTSRFGAGLMEISFTLNVFVPVGDIVQKANNTIKFII